MKSGASLCPICEAELSPLFGSRIYRCRNTRPHFLGLLFESELREIKGLSRVVWVEIITGKEYPPKSDANLHSKIE